jgi:hypothetical protein
MIEIKVGDTEIGRVEKFDVSDINSSVSPEIINTETIDDITHLSNINLERQDTNIKWWMTNIEYKYDESDDFVKCTSVEFQYYPVEIIYDVEIKQPEIPEYIKIDLSISESENE